MKKLVVDPVSQRIRGIGEVFERLRGELDSFIDRVLVECMHWIFGSTPAVPKATLISRANDGTIFRFTQTHFALLVLDSDRTARPPRV